MPILGILASTAVIPFPTGKAHMWYDASDTTTITVSGTAVTQWNDKGSSGVNLTQGTAANRPQSGTTTQNGLNVIDFDGGDVLLGTNVADWKFLHDGTKYVVGAVVKSSDIGGSSYALMSNIRQASGAFRGHSIINYTSGADTNRAQSYIPNDGVNVAIITSGNNIWSTTTAVCYTEIADPSNGTAAERLKGYIGNDAASYGTNAATGAASTSNPQNQMGIGATDLATIGVDGWIAEIVIMTGTNATETNRTGLRDYLKAKWNV